MNPLFFLTGASGTGKTTAAKMLEEKKLPSVLFCYFDSIGVPSPEDMIKNFGSPEEWQKQETINWVKRIKKDHLPNTAVVLDGQVRQTFIEEACKIAGVDNYKIFLFTCDDEVRNQRLVERGHPELATSEMSNWNKYLKEQAEKRGDVIVDTTREEVDEVAEKLERLIK